MDKICPICKSRINCARYYISTRNDGGSLACPNRHIYHMCYYENKYIQGSLPDCKHSCFYIKNNYSKTTNYK